MINLKRERLAMGISQRDLSYLANVAQSYVSLAESRGCALSESTLCKLAKALEWNKEPRELLNEYKKEGLNNGETKFSKCPRRSYRTRNSSTSRCDRWHSAKTTVPW